MISKSTYSAWVIALLAGGAAWYILRRSKQSNPPSLINNENTNVETYYPQYDMSINENLPRGYYNNNPLNIRKSNTAWKGKITPSQDSAFEQFVDLAYGYRAALVTLRTYITKYGLNTVRKMIYRWAPPEDNNNTESYIKNVCANSGLTENEIISANDKDKLSRMVYAMSISENGYKDKAKNDIKQRYDLPNMNIINEAWRLI